MPDDLLRFVSGTPPYSPWWLWLSLGLILLVIVWYTAVIVWTLPSERLRRLPGIRALHGYVVRRRFGRSVRKIVDGHRSGALPAADAGAELSRTLRSFLHQATGAPAQYMHEEAIAGSDLAAAGPVLSALNDARFNTASRVTLDEIGRAAEELIHTWS